MRYFLIRRPLLGLQRLPISEAEFNDVVDTRDRLYAQLMIEERFDLVASNFAEFLRAAFAAAVDRTLRAEVDVSNFDSARRRICRAFMNFLSAARGYLDQLRVSGSVETRDAVQQIMSLEYNGRLAYRVMEALRNYSQHASLPIDNLVFGSRWDQVEDPSKAQQLNTADPRLTLEAISLDGKFKASVLAELKGTSKVEFSLIPWAKEYVGCLSRINENVRGLHAAEYQRACDHFASQANRYSQFNNESNTPFVHALALCEDDSIVTEIYIGPRLKDAIEVLRHRNGLLSRLESVRFHL